MDYKRQDLIRDLASSFGMQDKYDSRTNGTHFDAGTGTLYCNGVTIPKSTVEKAKAYYKNQMDYYRARSEQSREALDMYLMNTVAYNSICLLEDNVNTDKNSNDTTG